RAVAVAGRRRWSAGTGRERRWRDRTVRPGGCDRGRDDCRGTPLWGRQGRGGRDRLTAPATRRENPTVTEHRGVSRCGQRGAARGVVVLRVSARRSALWRYAKV